MMKDLKVTLHFREKFHKECFLNCFTEEQLRESKKSNRGKDFVLHYGISEVSELDGTVHYSKQGKVNYQSDEERDKLFKKFVDYSAVRIQKEFLQKLTMRFDDILRQNVLRDLIETEMAKAFDNALLDLRNKLQEEN